MALKASQKAIAQELSGSPVVEELMQPKDNTPAPVNTYQPAPQSKSVRAEMAKQMKAEADAKKPAETPIVETTPADESAKEVGKVIPMNKEEQPKEVAKTEEVIAERDEDFLAAMNEGQEQAPIIDAQGKEVKTEANPKETKEAKAEVKTEVKPADPIYEHPLLKAVAESIRNGVTDLTTIAKNIGVFNDVSSMSVEDLYKMELEGEGLTGDDLEEALLEQMEAYEGMTRRDKIREEKALKAQHSSLAEKKISEYTANITAQSQEQLALQEKYTQAADQTMRQLVDKYKGKFFKNLKLDDGMLEKLQEVTPLYTPATYDDAGNFAGYDVETGFKNAAFAMYGDTILKATYNAGMTSGYEKWKNETARPNRNDTVSQTPVSQSDGLDQALENRVNKRWKAQGVR